MVIQTLKDIHTEFRISDGSVSQHTKSAQKITKIWQHAVCKDEIEAEVSVSPQNNERIDIVDHKRKIAYELKVSGKNTHHEFYKDMAKVLTYNEYKDTKARITKLVFISEKSGIQSLKNRLDTKFLAMLQDQHFLNIQLIEI